MFNLSEFLLESNRIEGYDGVAPGEVSTAERFLALEEIKVDDIDHYVWTTTVRHGAMAAGKLRNWTGMDVRVGTHNPPRGGYAVEAALTELLRDAMLLTPWVLHTRYEQLHPFTDGNGRSGRLLWLWRMQQGDVPVAPMGFLQTFYYQTLANLEKR